MRIIELKETVTASNDRDAERIRGKLKKSGTLLINLMSSPGSGKTTLLGRTIRELSDRYRIGVIEADIDSSVDAERMEKAGARSVQVHTDGMCHMDAGMTETGLNALEYADLDLIFLENVGNLICPAEYDTGACKNVMILSVPEGDDKPLKYPLMFSVSDAVLITKTDALPYFQFDIGKCCERIRRLNKDAVILPLSAKTGDRFEAWISWLEDALQNWKIPSLED
ncbi:MAG: hydrogenase nickel incorporation protein HypB [Oscillospiraceae bacterium]|nr:hydrogenase nickel incorporation protein HypB [Oscillospiraceae bacterium]